jgi:hypothetical protein
MKANPPMPAALPLAMAENGDLPQAIVRELRAIISNYLYATLQCDDIHSPRNMGQRQIPFSDDDYRREAPIGGIVSL